MKTKILSVLIPVYNGSSTLEWLFSGLESQKDKYLVEEILFIDDKSTDRSVELLLAYASESSYRVKVIQNPVNLGLAANYNAGMKMAATEFIVLMHQDILLEDPKSLRKIVEPLLADANVLAAHPNFRYPFAVWDKNSFWQKALFSRIVGKEISKLNGKFDCIRLEPRTPFDVTHYRTAGEDFDYEMRLKKIGIIATPELIVEHIQSVSEVFSLQQLFKKEFQLAECYGVNFRRYGREMKAEDIAIILVRVLLVLLVLIPVPVVSISSAFGLIALSFYYSKTLFFATGWDYRKIILPFINILIFFGYTATFAMGFARGRQTI